MTVYYTISELAKEFGVTPRTIRHYEEESLLAPRRDGTSRIFSSRDRARLKLALRSKRLGLSISEIRELFELYDGGAGGNKKNWLEEFLARIKHHRAWLEQQREDIAIMLSEISFFEAQCRKQLAAQQSKLGK
jgi:DNA-binding transcriptional MerR regulator